MKKKVLVVIQLIRRGGIELAAINFARHLDKNKFDIDFLLINPYEEQDIDLYSDLKKEGFGFTEIPKSCGTHLSKYKYIFKLMKDKKYDIVHSHVILFSGLVLMAAKKNGVRVRIAHSHIIKWNKAETIPYKLYKALMKALINIYANCKLACCKAAGEFLFGKRQYQKDGIMLANGIDISKYEFDFEKRKMLRAQLGLSDSDLLVGHVGSVYKIKNQAFLVKVFAEMLKKHPSARLVLVGEIFDREPVDTEINKYKLQDKVIWAGCRNDVVNFYQAMDIMIFPSLHEALPVSLIEAQASRLPCLVSATVSSEVKFNNNLDFISLDKSSAQWAEAAERLLNIDRDSVSICDLKDNYEINTVTKKLEKIYLN